MAFWHFKKAEKQQAEPTNKPTNRMAMQELGDTGLKRYGGHINEEFLRQLCNQEKYRTFREMRDNDAVIGGIMFATEMLLRNVSWETVAASEDPLDQEIAEFVETCMDDMEMTWEDVISEAITMLVYGFAPMETVYKRRSGMTGYSPSKHGDGRIGWKKISLRAQDTIESWEFGENGEIEGLNQYLLNGGTAYIPYDKMLLFRTESNKNNPEGRSIIRNAYQSWYYKKNIQSIEAIGIERDLAGLPIAYVPPEILNAESGSDEAAVFTEIKKIVRNIRRDEQEAVVWPLAYDENGKEMYRLELLSSSGNRQFDTDKIISRYDKRIAASILADFILLGQDGIGSLALSSDKTDLYALSLGTWLKVLASTFNRFAIPRLMEINGIDMERSPKLAYSDIEKEDVEKWATAVESLTGVGALTPSDELREKAETMVGITTSRE